MRSMVEGRARSALFQNQRDDPVQIIPNVRCKESKRLDSSRGKEEVAPLIARRIVPISWLAPSTSIASAAARQKKSSV
jgi:hypothetical protein